MDLTTPFSSLDWQNTALPPTLGTMKDGCVSTPDHPLYGQVSFTEQRSDTEEYDECGFDSVLL